MTETDRWGVGDQATAPAFDRSEINGHPIELIFGEHPHTRDNNNEYARDGDEVYAFTGLRRLINVTVTSENYKKYRQGDGWEVRPRVIVRVFSDGDQVYEMHRRTPADALLAAHTLLGRLSEHESDWLRKDHRDALPGRKIFYRDQPATIKATYVDQGAVLISTAPGFRPPARGDRQQELDYWDDLKVGESYEVKDDVLSPHIWWWRDE